MSDRVNVFLVSPGPSRAQCLVLLKKVLGGTSSEAKTQMESGRVLLASDSRRLLEEMVAEFEAIGAQLEMVEVAAPSWRPGMVSEALRHSLPSAIEQHVQQDWQQTLSEIRTQFGSLLHEVVSHLNSESDEAWWVFSSIISWRRFVGTPLTIPEAMIVAYLELYEECRSGGFLQYFSHPSGDRWRQVLKILVDGKDSAGEDHFRQTLSVFSGGEPSVDHSLRKQQIDALQTNHASSFHAHLQQQTTSYHAVPYPVYATLITALRNQPNQIFVPEVP